MSNSKKVFLILAAIFFAAVLYFVYDMARSTTFPGSKSRVEEQSGNNQEKNQVDK